MEFIPESMLKPVSSSLETLEASLLVECVNDQVAITFRYPGSSYQARVTVSNDTWREFCQHQLACPPPIPKGAKP
jgi:hypothetical protein